MSLLDGLLQSGGGHTIKTDGVELPKRGKLNFVQDTGIEIEGADSSDTTQITIRNTHGNQGRGSQHQVATTSEHGFHSSTDKRNHDALWNQQILVTPSGDTSGVTDQANINAAFAVTTKGVKLAPGVFYVDGGGTNTSKLDTFDMQNRRGARLSGAGAECTTVNYVGPRIPGRRMINMNSCVTCVVEGIQFNLGLIERFCSMIFNPSPWGQPTGNVIRHCWVWGPSTIVRGTSTTNATVSAGAKALTTQASLSAYLVVGSTCLAVSRATGERMYGTITSYNNGTGALAFTVASDRDCMIDPHLGSHSHTDWDVCVVPEGVYMVAAGSRVEHNWFARTWSVARVDGSFKCTCEYNFYSFGTMYGPPLSAGISTSTSFFSGPVEPDAYGWNMLMDLRESLACEVLCETGDGGTAGPFVKVSAASVPYIHGTFQAAGLGNTSAAIEATGVDRLIVDGCLYSTAYLVDFGSGATNNHPQVTNNVSFGPVSGVWTGTALGGAYNIQQDADLTPWIAKVRHDEAKIGFITQCNSATITTLLNSAGRPWAQVGNATLTAGVTGTISATLTAASRIVVTVRTPSGDANTKCYAALTADRVNGSPGTFKISALDKTAGGGALNTSDASVVDWAVFES